MNVKYSLYLISPAKWNQYIKQTASPTSPDFSEPRWKHRSASCDTCRAVRYKPLRLAKDMARVARWQYGIRIPLSWVYVLAQTQPSTINHPYAAIKTINLQGAMSSLSSREAHG